MLFGNGNILGYDLHRNIDADGKWKPAENTYVINPEQAETVRMIYDMYFAGLGYTKICKELCRLQRKDAYGKVSWCASKISRILHNMTYAGYKGYLKSYTGDFLEHSRVKNLDRDAHMYIKGDWKLHFMAKTILEALWLNRQDAVDEAIQLIKDNYVEDSDSGLDRLQTSNLEMTIARNESRMKQLLEMRMDNEITKDEYAQLREQLEAEIKGCKAQLEQIAEVEEVHEDLDEKLKEIKKTMEMMMEIILFVV